jgi:phage shock protein A
MLEQLIYPALLALVTATVTWLLARRKNIAEGKMAEVDVDMKSAALYQQLLDDAIKRINELLKLADGQREQLALQREQIENLMEEMETLTTEIKKYKQLNGKSQ